MNLRLTFVNEADRPVKRCLLASERQLDRESRAVSGLAIDFDSPMMPVDNPFRQTQPETRTIHGG